MSLHGQTPRCAPGRRQEDHPIDEAKAAGCARQKGLEGPRGIRRVVRYRQLDAVSLKPLAFEGLEAFKKGL
jgi:hypothetical protein